MGDLAWHFCAMQNGHPVLRDGRPLIIGEWTVHAGPVRICAFGLHASCRAIDALYYAPGPGACLVEVDDIVAEHADKLVCRRRRAIWAIDATVLLQQFARECALDVCHIWDVPAVVGQYLETGDEAVRAAALAAASAVASAAAGQVDNGITAAANASASAAAATDAWTVAADAVWAAAWAASRYAARDAVDWTTAWSAAWTAVVEVQNAHLESLLWTAGCERPSQRGATRKECVK